MAYQLLQGIRVTPKGNDNLARFANSLVSANKRMTWPTSYAFGGWIYNASAEIGFSSQPTDIKLSIVLEVIDQAQKFAFFDIQKGDLRCDAGEGKDENLYDIDFNGMMFQDFILHDYSISLESNVKILTVTFRDYSMILDKIYVGLLKRQGAEFVHWATSRLEFPVICPDCILAGDSLRQPAWAERDLSYGSYVGVGGKMFDNFRNIDTEGNIFRQWETLFQRTNSGKLAAETFDLNGGFLIIGTEEATEERCGDLAPISYNFNQLLASLRYRGFKFEGAFPFGSKDADYFYHQNYVGTLRETLQQWCSDLGYDFFCQGKTFIGINLNRAINIQSVIDIADPTTSIGQGFSANKDTAILSYKSSTSLMNTFKQGVITTNNRARNLKIHSKSPKRYVGILPLHPIDFNRHGDQYVIRTDAFGNPFGDVSWANDFEMYEYPWAMPATDRYKILPELDGRTFGDIDTAIALGRYDENLRDIFVQDGALYKPTPESREACFRALGFVPLVELTNDEYPEAKAMCIESLMAGGGDEIQSICLDKQFYRVFLGYYYPKYKQDITQWEQLAADSMYKYGIVVKGLMKNYPYMPRNSLTDMSPVAGLFGSQGTSYVRIQHNIEPAATQYFVMRQAPFKDLILYSGLMTPSSMGMPGLPVPNYRTGLFPTGLFYSELVNDWGSPLESFKRSMSLSFEDPCVADFQQNQGYTEMVNNIEKKYQDWRLDLFVPKISADLEKIWDIAAQALQSLPEETTYDRTTRRYYDIHHKLTQACSKLHIMVCPDTRNHPNLNFSCQPKGTKYINPMALQNFFDREREAIKRRVEMKTPTICDITLLQEMCRNLLSGAFQAGPSDDSRYGCIMDEDKWNWLEDGFTYPHLTRANSRGLSVNIVKNPMHNRLDGAFQDIFAASDCNGDFYYSDIINNLVYFETSAVNYTIVYPISSTVTNIGSPVPLPPIPYDPGNIASVMYDMGGYYRGVLTSQVDVENRTPEIVEIFGTPVNSTRNNTSAIKTINNNVDPDLQPQLDPFSMRFWAYMTVITGDSQVITTVQQYHKFVSQLNNYELLEPMKTVDLSLAGPPSFFNQYLSLSPNNGLTKLSMTVGDNGVITNLSYSDRPKVLPKQESILNKISARIR